MAFRMNGKKGMKTMTAVDGLNLTISRGDTLHVMFRLTGVGVKKSDTVTFTARPYRQRSRLLYGKATGLMGNRIYVIVPASITSRLTPGLLMYDLAIQNGDTAKALNFPASLRIVESMYCNRCVGSDFGEVSIMDRCGCGDVPAVTIETPADWGDIPKTSDIVTDVDGTADGILVTKGDGSTELIPDGIVSDEFIMGLFKEKGELENG